MRRIIILDIDGVLHNKQTPYIRANRAIQLDTTQPKHIQQRQHREAYTLDPSAIGLVCWIAEQADAKIVIGSHWRHTHGIDATYNKLVASGIPTEYFATPHSLPCFGSVARKNWDLGQWMQEQPWNPTEDKMVILDDEWDYTHHANLIRVNSDTGLTIRDAQRAAFLLGANTLPIPLDAQTKLLDIAQQDRYAVDAFIWEHQRYTWLHDDLANILLNHKSTAKIDQFWAEAQEILPPHPPKTIILNNDF